MNKLLKKDMKLIEKAKNTIKKRYKKDWHVIGAALRNKSGKIFSAVHIEANVGRIAVCAETIAIGMAVTAGDTEIDTIVAVDHRGIIVSPCGMCRELIADYSPEAFVIILGKNGPEKITINELLPNKYKRT